MKNIEKGESKLLEIEKMTSEAANKIKRYENPWEYMPLSYQGKQGKFYSEEEDRFLLCLAHRHGYGSWDKVKADLCASDNFVFDYYIRSRTAVEIGRRCDSLMRICERENLDFESKELRDNISRAKLATDRKVLENKIARVKEKLTSQQNVIDDKIRKEAAKMKEHRSFKRQWNERLSYEKKHPIYDTEAAMECFIGPLLRFMTNLGMNVKDPMKCTLKFMETYPSCMANLVLKAIKKMCDFHKNLWTVKASFLERLEEVEGTPSALHLRQVVEKTAKKSSSGSAIASNNSEETVVSSANTINTGNYLQQLGKKRKLNRSNSNSTTFGENKGGVNKKAKRGGGGSARIGSAGSQSAAALKKLKPVKKARSAYVLYSLAFRESVKATLPLDSNIVELMSKLTEMWKDLSDAERLPWEEKAMEDSERFKAEKYAFDNNTSLSQTNCDKVDKNKINVTTAGNASASATPVVSGTMNSSSSCTNNT